jgi:hypothetical protein
MSMTKTKRKKLDKALAEKRRLRERSRSVASGNVIDEFPLITTSNDVYETGGFVTHRVISSEVGGDITREFSINREAVDVEGRTASLSFSSQDAVQDRWFGPPTVLLHEKRAVNLSVMKSIGSALLNHDPSIDSIVGPVRSIEIDEGDRKGRAVIAFDDDDTGNKALAKVQSGSLRGVSVRFSVDKAQVLEAKQTWESPGGQKFSGGERGLEVATKWTPREISLTPVPADVAVGVGRQETGDNTKETPMEFSKPTLDRLAARGLEAEFFSSEDAAIKALDKLDAKDKALDKLDAKDKARSDPPPAAEPVAEPTAEPAAEKSRETWDKESRARLKIFGDLAERAGKPEKAVQWYNDGATVEAAQRETIAILAECSPTPIAPATERGMDAVDKLRTCCEGAIFTRGGLPYERPEGFREEIPTYMRYEDMARAWLRAHNVDAHYLTPEQAIERAWVTRASSHASGDFPLLLANVANKSMQIGFMEAPVTYPAWTNAGSIPDFKQADRPNVGEIQDFELTPDGMPFPESTISEKREQLTLANYARKFSIGRQALINDDQRGLTQFPRMFGQAGNRTIDVAAYAHLTSASGVGPTMVEDSKALFATDHPSGANYITGTGTTLQQPQIGVVTANMMKQLALTASNITDAVTISNARINIAPSILLVPAALAQTADTLVNGSYVPTTAATAVTSAIRALQVVVSAQLDGATDGATAWYLVASPTAISTVEVARLAGQAGPGFRTWELQDGLGFYWAGWVDFAVQALEHRGMGRSKGAA